MELVKEFFSGAVKIIKPKVFGDERGFFMESYNEKNLLELGIKDNFIQDNHSLSTKKGVVRGFHFQGPGMAQSKLVRVVKGKVLDVFVDIRTGSPTYGKSESIELSDENFLQAYIPKGFAHGFCTLTDDCHFLYKVDNYYSGENNQGVIWNDSDISFSWPDLDFTISEQDKKWGTLKDLPSFFKYEGDI